MAKYVAAEVLAAREERADFIERLIEQYKKPVITLRVNYPGLEKTNALTLKIIREISSLLGGVLEDKTRFQAWLKGADGPAFLAVVEEDVFALKRTAIEMEESHSLGRLVDFDVYDVAGNSISRREMGYPVRRCYLCADDGQHCVRARRHSEQEVIAFMEEQFRNYQISKDLGKWRTAMTVL